MSPPPQQVPKLDVILTRLDSLQGGVHDLTVNMAALSCNVQNFQLTYTQAHAQLVSDVAQALKRLDKLDVDMEKIDSLGERVIINTRRLDEAEEDLKALKAKYIELADAIKPLVFVMRIVSWVAIALGGSVIALIWGILTHAITIVRP